MARDQKSDPRYRISKYLSLHLRHQPEALGLKLGPGGWVSVPALLEAAARKGFPISREELEDVVATNEKKRFSFDASGTQVRANQGHSVAVDLQLEPVEPPAILYHGTGAASVAVILAEGLAKMSRHHVHLSPDIATALKVGRRHGAGGAGGECRGHAPRRSRFFPLREWSLAGGRRAGAVSSSGPMTSQPGVTDP